MRRKYLLLVIALVVISLAGLTFTQVFWLSRSVSLAEKQYDDRADRMLEDVLAELEQFNDTASIVHESLPDSLILFDVIDTVLLQELITKYINYHRLDSLFEYGLVRTSDDKIFQRSPGFRISMDDEASKACLSCIWKKEYIHLSVFFPRKKIHLYQHMMSWIILSVIFLLIIMAVFSFVIYSIIRQKKISEIRNDFINNMTHEFKTPISTISLAAEILMREDKKPDSDRIKKYSGIIYEENKRMQSQVELVLQTALIERQNIKLKKEEVNLHEIILNVGERFGIDPLIHAEINYNLSATKPRIRVDPTHIRNVFSNLIDNGIKYSGSRPVIGVDSRDLEGGVLITISDNGVGISRELQKRIFEKFYRVSTGDKHDVKGFGLGLYYVKTIVEAHRGYVHVNSTPNKGSTFFVFLPGEDVKKP